MIANWAKALQDIHNRMPTNNPESNMDKLFNSLQAGNSEMQGLFEITYLYLQSVGAGSATHLELQNRMNAIPTSVVQDQIDRGSVIRAVTLATLAAMYENILKNGQLEKLKSASEQFLKFLGIKEKNRKRDSREAEDEYWDDLKKAAESLVKTDPNSEKFDFFKKELIDACEKLEEVLPKDNNILKESVAKIKDSILKDVEKNTPRPQKLKKS